MTTELDRIAKKNLDQKIRKAYKKLDIKQHNIKAALKANKADPEEQGWFGSKRSKSLRKELNKTRKIEKFVDKQSDRLDKHGVWSKENKEGAAMGHYEKKKIIEKGFPSKAKFAGGGIALRGFGRAFRGGGKV